MIQGDASRRTELKMVAYLAQVQFRDFDNINVLFLILHPLQKWFCKYQVIPPTVIDRKRGKTGIEPSVQSIVQGTFPIGESASTAPPGG